MIDQDRHWLDQWWTPFLLALVIIILVAVFVTVADLLTS